MSPKDLDQTIFSEEQQFVDEDGAPIAAASSAKRKKTAIVLGLAVLFVMMCILAILSQSRKPNTQGVLPSPSPTPQTQQENTYLDQLFDELHEQVDAADPSENILPFPPIEADIRIQAPQPR